MYVLSQTILTASTRLTSAVVSATPLPTPDSGAVPTAQAPAFINGSAVWGLLIFVASLVIAFIGLYAMLVHGKKGDVKGAAGSLGVVAIGSLIIAIGVAGTFVGVASGAFNAFFNVNAG